MNVRCSDWARAAALSPIGTCGPYAGYLLVEIPLPWPRDVAEIPQGAEITALIAPLRYRLQAIIPADPGEVKAGRTVPVPGCMEPASSAAKSETEWAVTAVRRVASPRD